MPAIQAGTNPISLGGQSTFTAGSDGTLTISGLRYSDYANGASVAAGDPAFREYWLAEVKAPAGYELLAAPIKFDVTAATTAVGVDLTIKNMPANAGFALPFTGGPGGLLVYATCSLEPEENEAVVEGFPVLGMHSRIPGRDPGDGVFAATVRGSSPLKR